MVQMRSVNAGEVRFIDRTGRVEAGDLGAERIRKGTDHEGQGLSSFSGAELSRIDLSLTGSVAAGRTVVNRRRAISPPSCTSYFSRHRRDDLFQSGLIRKLGLVIASNLQRFSGARNSLAK